MTVLGALAGLGRPQNAVQATPWGEWGDATGPTWSGANVTTSTSTQLLTVYGCNRFICDGISTLPLDVLRRIGDGSPVPVRPPHWLDEPASGVDRVAWITQVLTSLLLAGNFYGAMVFRDAALVEIVPLDPTKVTVRRERGRKVFVIEDHVLTSFEILHIPGVMWPGSDVGMSPVEAARQSIGMGMSAQEFGARFFGQGAVMAGVIEYEQAVTPDKARQIARGWAKHHSGAQNSHLPGVLEGGGKWKPTGVTNEQAQFLETRRFTASEIAAQMFLIDPAEMGLPVEGSSLTYANLEQRNARKVQVTFLPWLIRLERALTALLPRPQYVKFNVNGLLRGDMKTRFESYGIAIDKKFMVPNEAREFEDWPALEGGDAVVETPPPTPPVMEPAP